MKKKLIDEECDHIFTAMYETHDGALVNKCTNCPFSYILSDEQAKEHWEMMEDEN